MSFIKKLEKWSGGLVREGMPASEWLAFIFIFFGLLVFFAVFVLAKFDSLDGKGTRDIVEYGDFLSGSVGSLWSLASVLLFYAALADQRQDLEAQKDLIQMQIGEVVNQTKEFKKQNETATDQKNEGTVFQLLRFHNEIISSILLEIQDMDFADGSTTTRTISGRKSFVEYYDIYKRFFNTQFDTYATSNITKDILQTVIDSSYEQFYEEYQADLGHYFRNVFNILKFIDGLPESNRHFFISLLNAQLSNFELALFFFHCLIEKNKDFKELLEKYSLIATVPMDEITGLCKKLYTPKAYGLTEFEEDDEMSMGFDLESNNDWNNNNNNDDENSFNDINVDNGDIETSSNRILAKLQEMQKGKNNETEKSDHSNNPILAKLANLQKLRNEDNSYEEDEPSNSILSKFKNISQKSSYLDNDDSDGDNDIMAKLSKLKKNDEYNDESDGDNDIMAKLSKLKKNDEYNDESDGENDIMAKLSKLKKNDEYNDESDGENDIMAKLSKLKKNDEQNDESDGDNDIMAKLSKLKKNDNPFLSEPESKNDILDKLRGISNKNEDDDESSSFFSSNNDYIDTNDFFNSDLDDEPESKNDILDQLRGISNKNEDDDESSSFFSSNDDDDDSDTNDFFNNDVEDEPESKNDILDKIRGISNKNEDDDESSSFFSSNDDDIDTNDFFKNDLDDEPESKNDILDKLRGISNKN
ncbi:MAG: hypothetical protein NTW25_09500, partial [Candidatus Kapabacteria bacterium]|nr:hypothetical protein [Candidatus Kapabacteria bacterium]